MQMCQAHWDRLREAVKDCGLEAFVAKNGEDALERVVSSLHDHALGASNFDPLMGANFAIWSAFLQDVGIAGLAYDGCPLCAVKEQDPELDAEWIRGSVADQLAYARRLELVAPVQ